MLYARQKRAGHLASLTRSERSDQGLFVHLIQLALQASLENYRTVVRTWKGSFLNNAPIGNEWY